MLADRIEMKLTGSGNVGWTRVRKYWEVRPLLLSVLIVIAFVSPFLGFFIAGVWPGTIAGLVISAVTFVAGFFAATRVRDTERSR